MLGLNSILISKSVAEILVAGGSQILTWYEVLKYDNINLFWGKE